MSSGQGLEDLQQIESRAGISGVWTSVADCPIQRNVRLHLSSYSHGKLENAIDQGHGSALRLNLSATPDSSPSSSTKPRQGCPLDNPAQGSEASHPRSHSIACSDSNQHEPNFGPLRERPVRRVPRAPICLAFRGCSRAARQKRCAWELIVIPGVPDMRRHELQHHTDNQMRYCHFRSMVKDFNAEWAVVCYPQTQK